MTILEEIIERKKQDLIEIKKDVSLNELALELVNDNRKCLNFVEALKSTDGKPRIIAELKKASPSKGMICPDLDPAKFAKELEAGGASALSVLTEEHYFEGSVDNLIQAKSSVSIPVLQKDFIVDGYQIAEAKLIGADAILLIASALKKAHYSDLYAYAKSLGLYVLTEVHNFEELDMVLDAGAEVIGVNSRNLHTFKVDLNVTKEIIANIPDSYVKVAESGVKTSDDIQMLLTAGTDAFLIGETLMKDGKPGKALKKLLSIF
ncbi:MAG: indole-3-glycerol phosphate synthase TrpC [Kiritimatiellae bacterium]|jgi:indole-3-glycerol phosphate synthase|nr:indole-3-glycerol phosphate synthase TrpC [Kiritimatiellia bacterium]